MWSVQIESDALRQRKLRAAIDGIGLTAHIYLPGIRSRFTTTTCFFLSTKCTAYFRTGSTNIDIGNYAQHNQDVVDAIQAIGSRAVYAHLKDKSGVSGEPPIPLGDGILPLRDILHALEQLPQQVLYCFEFRGGDDPEAGIARSLAFLRKE